jgi:hypothetical protein
VQRLESRDHLMHMAGLEVGSKAPGPRLGAPRALAELDARVGQAYSIACQTSRISQRWAKSVAWCQIHSAPSPAIAIMVWGLSHSRSRSAARWLQEHGGLHFAEGPVGHGR